MLMPTNLDILGASNPRKYPSLPPAANPSGLARVSSGER